MTVNTRPILSKVTWGSPCFSLNCLGLNLSNLWLSCLSLSLRSLNNLDMNNLSFSLVVELFEFKPKLCAVKILAFKQEHFLQHASLYHPDNLFWVVQTWLPFRLHVLSLYPFDYACWVCTNTIMYFDLYRPNYACWVCTDLITYFEFVLTWLRILSLFRPDYVFWVCTDLITYLRFVPTWLRIFCSNFWMSPRLTFGWDRTWDRSSASNVSRSLANTKPMERNNSPLQSETSEVCKNIQPWVFKPV